jgi:hypothetical protein
MLVDVQAGGRIRHDALDGVATQVNSRFNFIRNGIVGDPFQINGVGADNDTHFDADIPIAPFIIGPGVASTLGVEFVVATGVPCAVDQVIVQMAAIKAIGHLL